MPGLFLKRFWFWSNLLCMWCPIVLGPLLQSRGQAYLPYTFQENQLLRHNSSRTRAAINLGRFKLERQLFGHLMVSRSGKDLTNMGVSQLKYTMHHYSLIRVLVKKKVTKWDDHVWHAKVIAKIMKSIDYVNMHYYFVRLKILWNLQYNPKVNNFMNLQFAWIPANTCIFKSRLRVDCYANLGNFVGAALWSIGLQSSRPLCGRKSGGTLTLILFMSTQRAAQGSFSVRPVQTEGWCGRVFEGAGLHWLLGRERLTGQH